MSGEISPLVASLNVAVGGAVGSVLRYHAGRWVGQLAGAENTFPWGTLAINIVGSLAMGALVGWLARGTMATANAEPLRLLIGVGLLGGFTTFSAFSSELVTMLHRGQTMLAVGYAAASLIAGMAAIIIGLVAAQSAS
ncbi:fluoride efflux transporter CrcB [Porphyrobacter sp. ULC335]|jgi:fluoride exporter|uniref:fluoride efflux transporter CrcB n=1 Tax=Porphyrobacter sp. ULC335 TaxID=2854260 RepID=UPI0022212A82|nr:fluoride efflux transporter CrcB [Porphyrobacter sp. ULC335]UYV15579.1 fluoride efflux transporter CrcB [Porphyrobacter sp. ULC335]